MRVASHPMSESDSSLDESDESLAELLTLTRVVWSGFTIYTNSAGQRHRRHGPAVIYPCGSKFWFQNGLHHRSDGPAEIHPDGTEHWYLHGNRHRVDGPAVIHPGGRVFWWLRGQQLTESEWKRRVALENT